jgi:hypothetical protein
MGRVTGPIAALQRPHRTREVRFATFTRFF